MATKQSNAGNMMTPTHSPVVIDGKRLGDVVTLDTKVVFYTTVSALAHLDGQRFDDNDDVERAVRAALKKMKAA